MLNPTKSLTKSQSFEISAVAFVLDAVSIDRQKASKKPWRIAYLGIWPNGRNAQINLFNRGARVAMRGKVNETLMTGLRLVDILLPLGRGQRMLVMGDRGTGKTSCAIAPIICSSRMCTLSSMEGFGSKRLFGLYVGLHQNLSRIYSLLMRRVIDWRLNVMLATSPSSSAVSTFMVPIASMTMAELCRDRGFDAIVILDDLIKHSKSYRQLSLIIGSMPARQSYPSNIFNVHATLLERSASIAVSLSSITALPLIETMNSDISEYIATNVISITDGQLLIDRSLFHSAIRPSIDPALSVSRIGAAAQNGLMAKLSIGMKSRLIIHRTSVVLSNAMAADIIGEWNADADNRSDGTLFISSISTITHAAAADADLNALFYQHPLQISAAEAASLAVLLLHLSLAVSLHILSSIDASMASAAWFGMVALEWMAERPRRLIILSMLRLTTSHDILLALHSYAAVQLLVLLYIIAASANGMDAKLFHLAAYFML